MFQVYQKKYYKIIALRKLTQIMSNVRIPALSQEGHQAGKTSQFINQMSYSNTGVTQSV